MEVRGRDAGSGEEKAVGLGDIIRDHVSHVEATVRYALPESEELKLLKGRFRWRFKNITAKALVDGSYLSRVLKGQNNMTFIKLADLCAAMSLNIVWIFARLFEREGREFCRRAVQRFLQESGIAAEPPEGVTTEEYIDRCVGMSDWNFWEVERLPDSIPEAEQLNEYFAPQQKDRLAGLQSGKQRMAEQDVTNFTKMSELSSAAKEHLFKVDRRRASE